MRELADELPKIKIQTGEEAVEKGTEEDAKTDEKVVENAEETNEENSLYLDFR